MPSRTTGSPGSTPESSSTRQGRTRVAPTIYDVAKLAGVNASTVSRALGNPGRVSTRLTQKVQDAAAELNYRVNPLAKALLTGRTQTIGLLISDITNPMFFDIVRGAERAAGDQNYTLIYAESAESQEREATVAAKLMASVDGLILASPRIPEKHIQDLAREKPVVVINRIVPEVANVVANNAKGIEESIRHLAALGHRSVAYVGGPKLSWMSAHRWEHIKNECARVNMNAVHAGRYPPTLAGGHQAAASIQASEETAVLTHNDLMAIGLLQELTLQGVSVPADVSIIGFDDIFGSDFTTPALSSIKSPLKEVGATAALHVFEELNSGLPSQLRYGLDTELIVRASTGPAPRRRDKGPQQG